jgi:hypothetical protein
VLTMTMRLGTFRFLLLLEVPFLFQNLKTAVFCCSRACFFLWFG